MNCRSGGDYLDPQTGEKIDIPEGKTLRSVDPEAARFYEALGDTKVTGELHNAVGDIYMDYMNIPESVVSRSGFENFRSAYYIYAENPTIKNGAVFLEEASKIYDMPGVTQYTFDPMVTMDAAANARFRGMLDEVQVAREAGMTLQEYLSSKGATNTFTDVEAAAADVYGLGMKKMDGEGDVGYNGKKGASLVFKLTPELENHIMYADPSTPRNRGIGGAHNSEEFFKNDVNIVKAIPSEDIPGITYYEYTMPLLGKDKILIGGYGKKIHKKTVYDPKVFSHSEYVKRGLEAANYSYRVNGLIGAVWEGFDSQGVKWIGYGRNGKPTSFFPDVI